MEIAQDRQRNNLDISVDAIGNIDKQARAMLDNRFLKRATMLGAVTLVCLGTGVTTSQESEPMEQDISNSMTADPNLVADAFIRQDPAETVSMEMLESLYEFEPVQEPPKPVVEKEPKEEKHKEESKEKPKEISYLEAAKILSKSDHKYAKCGHIIVGFMEAGYSYEQSVGAAANSAVESWDAASGTGCNPDKHQDKGGPARGIFQWESRFGGAEALARDRGVSPYTMDVQIDYAIKELNSTEKRAKGLLKDTKTIEDATRVFCEDYERPGVPHMDRRQKAAKELHDELKSIKKG